MLTVKFRMKKRCISALSTCSLLFAIIVFLNIYEHITYNRDYLEFLHAKALYNSVTSYSNGTVIEVNVIQDNALQDEDKENDYFHNAGKKLPRGYLG